MELFFEQAIRREVGVLARVPLASRLLTGKFHAGSSFQSDDHRDFNRMGEFFDQGETFSGVDFSLALVTVDKLKLLLPSDCSGESKGRGQIRGRG